MEVHHRTRLPGLALLLVTLLGACQEQVEQPPPPVRPVLYTVAKSTGGLRTRAFTGAAKAGIESKISFKVGGTLEELPVKVGDVVYPGALIAKIDCTDYELKVEDTEASLAQARAQAINADADLDRMRGLFERDNASPADYDAAQAGADSAAANVRSWQKKLETAKLQVRYCTLESPIGAAVADVPVEVNENVSQGETIALLNAGVRPEVEVAIPEILIGEVRRGAPATVTFDAVAGEFVATVTEVGVAPAEGLTTYPVTVALNEDVTQRGDMGIRPGMAAEVAFRFGSADERPRYVLPPHAVLEDREGRFVFVVDDQGQGLGTVERRPVTVGELVTEGLEVFQGLQDGDLVVTSGVSRIQDGQQVKISPANEMHLGGGNRG